MFINRSELITQNPIQLNYGVAVTDIDYDGDFEFFVAGFGYPNSALKWDGQQYVNVIPSILADADRRAIGLATADIDGDGREEIYILNTDTYSGQKRFADRLFVYGLDGWVDLFSLAENTSKLNLTAGRSVACVDRFGNGQYSFFVANYGGPMRLYGLDDDGMLCDWANQALIAQTTGGRSVMSFPILTDRMDIFAGNENGPNFLFRNNGDGTFTDVAQRLGLDDPFENARGVAPLDTSSSDKGFLIVLGNWEGPHRIFAPSSDGMWDDIAPRSLAVPSRVRTVIVADFDNDGYEEIFFNNIGESNRLFGWRGSEWKMMAIGDANEALGLGTGAAVADLDKDGRLELLISHGESNGQPLTIYHTPPNDNHYLRVYPTTQYGAPARGAIVTLWAGDRVQRRVIDAGSGYLCQMEPIAHFGLGTLEHVERIEVMFTDSKVVRVDHPAIDSVVRVPYQGS
jgi:hypothetical protein